MHGSIGSCAYASTACDIHIRTLCTVDYYSIPLPQYGQTPLHIAASSGNYEIVKLLIVDAFSDVNATSKVCLAMHIMWNLFH